MTEVWQEFINKALKFVTTKSLDIAGALVVFLIGVSIINWTVKILKKWLVKLKVDLSLHAFILAITRITLIVLLGVSCLGMSGLVETTSLVTALGAVGLAISLAVKDSLANLAGGLMMLFTKPFAVGNYISACDREGTVAEIGIVHTVLNTVDNKRIYLPNGDIAKSQIINYNSEPIRRLDITFHIGYSDDFEKAKTIVKNVINKSGFALNDPAPPFVRLGNHGSSSIELFSRTWVDADNYWELNFYLKEEVKREFDKACISIPFNQLDVHLINSNAKGE